MKNYAIIAAGGSGSRLKIEGGKQLLKLMGRPVVAHSIQYFQDSDVVDEIIIVTEKNSITAYEQLVLEYEFTKVRCITPSGATRQQSIANGLAQLMDARYVFIHDGARPLMREEYISDIIGALSIFDGAIIAVPVTDTIKKITTDGIVETTLNRSELVSVQTPQGFRFDILKKAYELEDKHLFTDDSSMVEKVGGTVKVIDGSPENIKITYPPDVLIAERLMKSRERKELS
ncbi:MAG: 2-C-methyl-D-erythritol 4-phosphate cytidylyltransferase [Candidatus Margulisiibacteriota bacterium]|nr:MAG: 2-C-methyl-D-erythritol 4-phosphate cytidylyltransferase [Candidatus Margulisbacteria bacterium GWD2_39_127]OGI03249.1 MAG: 2-C-methyl-D-erythritol 4-phosphate cytidylyltransferase [Candidatus Margulisbacteria bacterium GWF2_38_17]OGI11272.1 MAG: 2-C-methyl-D-erythritol 4-phosphate cytidylyltransferase [Candidatus Margulisbacteria bacterium GWE2_39_32]PZM78507.1 MAG: 2-C-methyl-D-erythritol 4-phosphate cytidylyltransferase [Candidatus Margulisiibacteriota bacterium]HAR63928.1 2-C-methyl